MHQWLDRALACLADNRPVVLVSVASVRGSAPREAGAKMLVAREQQWFTVGGGRLEWLATQHARAHLGAPAGAALRWVEDLPLAASLGQCCGGLVTLLFEHLQAADRAWLEDARTRLLRLESFEREVGLGAPGVAPWVCLRASGRASRPASRFAAARLLDAVDVRGCPVFTEPLRPDDLNILVFGAGHVGRALVDILQTLPCRVTWVDARADLFPASVAANVAIEATDTPEAVIDQAPPESCFLVMTHDHALDQHLCEQIMRRDDVAYFGLIGSRTKRHKFCQRFAARGIPAQRYERILCPIGEPGIGGKDPAVIAVSVAAQLMRLRTERARQIDATPPVQPAAPTETLA